MGTNCGSHSSPQTDNLCHVSVGDLEPNPMPGFCTLLGPAGDSYRNSFCNQMSTAGEWGDPSTDENNCSYNDCNGFQDFGFGCCDGCCGIIGGGVKCRRLSFTGDPVTCCLNDLDCSSDSSNTNPLCFSDAAKQNTCADGQNGQPNYRSIVSLNCQGALQQYCTGTLPSDDPNSTAWLSRWTVNNGGTGSCAYAIGRNIFQAGGTGHCFTPPTPIPGICSAPPPLPIDSEGYFWAQQLISSALAKYSEQGFTLGSLPGFPGYNPFQDFLYSNICCPYPGLCQNGLDIACSTTTAQRISLNPNVAQWCGCHLPAGEYQSYSVLYNIPPECTPMCNRAGTVPIVGINATPVTCQQNVCLIDNVTVNLINSQIGNGINFTQVCGNCSGQCSCVVANTTIDIANSTIGGNLVPINEGCGNFNCMQTNPGTTGPSMIPVPCGTTAGFNPYAQYQAEVAAEQAAANKSAIFWTLVAIGAALFVIFLIIFFIHPNLYPSEGVVISRSPQSITQSNIQSSLQQNISSNYPQVSYSQPSINYQPIVSSPISNNVIQTENYSNNIGIGSNFIRDDQTFRSIHDNTINNNNTNFIGNDQTFRSIQNNINSDNNNFTRDTSDFRSINSSQKNTFNFMRDMSGDFNNTSSFNSIESR